MGRADAASESRGLRQLATPDEGVRGAPAAGSTVAVPPLQASVRVRTETIDRFLGAVGEVILSSSQLRTSADEMQMGVELSAGFDAVERRVTELQRRVLDLRTTPLARVMETLPRTVRQLAEQLGKRIEVELAGTELDLDRSILDRLNEPLLHVVRNAVDHGIETPAERVAAGKDEVGHITIAARRKKDSIIIDVSDDGAGIDLESVRDRAIEAGLLHPDLAEDLPPSEIAALIFRPGISTAENVSAVSGRGVGMDAVKATIESLGGVVELRSERGKGTTTSVVVPITAAVQRVLLCAVSEERVALPITKVERILEVPAASIERSGPELFTLIDDEPVLVIDLAERLAVDPPPPTESVPLVVVDIRGEAVAVRVERFVGQQEIYVKPVPKLLSEVRLLAGFTVLGDGSPVFLLDLNHLA
jgi:two-component system chemotaxis sensor kinase CheA